MKSDYSKLRNFPLNKTSPFIDGVVEIVNENTRVKRMFATGKNADSIIDGDTGELKGHAVFAKRYEVDSTQFAKLYISDITSFMDLSKTGIRVLLYVISKMMKDRDYVHFDMEEAMTFTNYKSKKSVFSGITELLQCKFLARGSNPYLYFINPSIAFNGSRYTLLKDVIVKDSSNKIELSEEAKKMIENT